MGKTKPTTDITFSAEQMSFLRNILAPRCCHISGMHDPTHSMRYPERFCQTQKSEAWESAVEQLGLTYETYTPRSGCYWCQRNSVGRELAGEVPFDRGSVVLLHGRRATVLTCYWGPRDGVNQWLIDVKYDDGTESSSCNQAASWAVIALAGEGNEQD